MWPLAERVDGNTQPSCFVPHRARRISKNSPTHGDQPSAFWCFAVGDQDQAVLPVQIFNPHPVEFTLISHPSVTHQDDDLTKEAPRPLSPIATVGCCEQLPFCVIIQSE